MELKDSKLAGVFGYVPQQMFDFDPEWWVLGTGGSCLAQCQARHGACRGA